MSIIANAAATILMTYNSAQKQMNWKTLTFPMHPFCCSCSCQFHCFFSFFFFFLTLSIDALRAKVQSMEEKKKAENVENATVNDKSSVRTLTLTDNNWSKMFVDRIFSIRLWTRANYFPIHMMFCFRTII